MTAEELREQKDVEFYAASVAAWFNTTLEHDKSVLTLSAGGIGLLITLLTTFGVSNGALVVLYISAILAFLASLVSVLCIFKRNQTHIENMLTSGESNKDPILTVLDQFAILAFGVGAILTAMIGISTAIVSYTEREKNMDTDKKSVTQTEVNKSFNNIGKLQPAASVPVQAPVQSPAQAAVEKPVNSSSGTSKQ